MNIWKNNKFNIIIMVKKYIFLLDYTGIHTYINYVHIHIQVCIYIYIYIYTYNCTLSRDYNDSLMKFCNQSVSEKGLSIISILITR